MNCWIEINSSALTNNYQLFAEACRSTSVVPIIKSNAYGHGLFEVFQALKAAGPSWLGVNYHHEAAKLRSWGYTGRILLVGPLLPEDLAESGRLDLDVTIGNRPLLDVWLQTHPKPKLHLKIDTGLARLGFGIQGIGDGLEAAKPFREDVVGICSHFANVEDVTELSFAQEQLRIFDEACQLACDQGFQLLRHTASSASALIFDPSRLDLVRVGISMYGFWPSELTRLSYLAESKSVDRLPQPVLSWRAKICNIRYLNSGSFVGYGCTFKAERDMLIAVLPVGYFEGYPRLAAERGAYVLIQGKRCPIIGRICMNMLIVDVSSTSGLTIGDIATLIGEDGGETVRAEDLARWSQTIQYEIVTRLHPALPRIVK